jgi:dTDP-4-dehydrorhamnose 3,5-epimerase-like enzyme
LRFDDPDLAISWPILGCPFLLSDKDHQAPALAVAELFE